MQSTFLSHTLTVEQFSGAHGESDLLTRHQVELLVEGSLLTWYQVELLCTCIQDVAGTNQHESLYSALDIEASETTKLKLYCQLYQHQKRGVIHINHIRGHDAPHLQGTQARCLRIQPLKVQ